MYRRKTNDQEGEESEQEENEPNIKYPIKTSKKKPTINAKPVQISKKVYSKPESKIKVVDYRDEEEESEGEVSHDHEDEEGEDEEVEDEESSYNDSFRKKKNQ